MTLENYILTYKGIDDSGKEGIVCNIPDYYDRYVKQLRDKFSDCSFHANKLVICCFHDDNDPSLGLINHRHYDGVKVYHCFGCGSSGTVIRMHQIIEEMYHNRKLSETEACYELAKLFNIPLDNIKELADDDFEGKYARSMMKIDRLQYSYTIREYSDKLLELRKSEPLGSNSLLDKVNNENIKMIATHKKLYF